MSENNSTEEKILKVATKIFMKKGFAATKTREIAEAAQINLALLNYYFRSKKRLFDMIIDSSFRTFFSTIVKTINDDQTSLDHKLEVLSETYISMLLDNPDLPRFILNEMSSAEGTLMEYLPKKVDIRNSSLVLQIKEAQEKAGIDTDPIHALLNTLSFLIFPFMARPMVSKMAGVENDEFVCLMEERKKMIPIWVKQSLGI